MKHSCIVSWNSAILTQFHCSSLICLKVGCTKLKVNFFLPVDLPDNLYKPSCVNISVGISEVSQVILFSVTAVIKEFCTGNM